MKRDEQTRASEAVGRSALTASARLTSSEHLRELLALIDEGTTLATKAQRAYIAGSLATLEALGAAGGNS